MGKEAAAGLGGGGGGAARMAASCVPCCTSIHVAVRAEGGSRLEPVDALTVRLAAVLRSVALRVVI